MNASGQLIYRLAAIILDSLPGGLRKLVTDFFAAGCYILCLKQRANVRANLAVTGSDVSPSRVYRVFRTHTLNVIEMFTSSRWSNAQIARRIEFPDRNLLDAALAAGRGAILATAHIGNWELPALYLRSLGYRMHVVAGVQMNTLLSAPVRNEKERRGISVIGPGHGPGYRRLFRALAEGGIVALLLDGDVFTGGRPARLFGRQVTLPIGAERLSLKTGAPVIGAFGRRQGDEKIKIHLETVLEAGEAARVGEMQARRRIEAMLERFIADNNDQWCLFRRFWKESA